ncbi:hypothetical protein BGX38DRAFT_1138365 [Terfezia claveryi]|nr:hypothetical protein BGX38DRAFT_1138365 [Terfezia claveryi]
MRTMVDVTKWTMESEEGGRGEGPEGGGEMRKLNKGKGKEVTRGVEGEMTMKGNVAEPVFPMELTLGQGVVLGLLDAGIPRDMAEGSRSGAGVVWARPRLLTQPQPLNQKSLRGRAVPAGYVDVLILDLVLWRLRTISQGSPPPIFRINVLPATLTHLAHSDNLILLCAMCHRAFDGAHPNWVMVPMEETLNLRAGLRGERQLRTLPNIDRGVVLYQPCILSEGFPLVEPLLKPSNWPKIWGGEPTAVIIKALLGLFQPCEPRAVSRPGYEDVTIGVPGVLDMKCAQPNNLWSRRPPQVSEPTPSKGKKRVRGVDEEDKGKGGEEEKGMEERAEGRKGRR